MEPAVKWRIFISYRRSDTGDVAGRIDDRLVHRFGRENVFFDVNEQSNPAGHNYVNRIREQIQRADVVLVLIGEKWLAPAGLLGGARLLAPDDQVRREIELGFEAGCKVLPVLVNRPSMPEKGELPSSLAGMCEVHACRVQSGEDFDHHMNRLFQAIEQLAPLSVSGAYRQRIAAARATRLRARELEDERRQRMEDEERQARREHKKKFMEHLEHTTSALPQALRAAPVLAASPTQRGARLSWSPVPGAATYRLQRAGDPEFIHSEDVYVGEQPSIAIETGSGVALTPLRTWRPQFYYRVQAYVFGLPGDWSNVIRL